MGEWVGRLVTLNRDIQSKGGVVFLKGEVMVVTGHHRGGLSLNRPAKTSDYLPDNDGHAVTKVSRDEVTLLPAKPGKVLEAMLKGVEELAKRCGGVLTYEVVEDGKKKLGKFEPKKVGMLRSVTSGCGIVRGEDGLPTALMLG